MAGCFTRGNYNTLIQILMTYDESLDGHDVPHFSIKPICGSLCHVQLRHVCWQTLNNLFAFWTISRPDLHRSSRPWVYVDGGCGMKHLELQWNSLILFRREKTLVTFSDFSLYLPRRPFSNLIWAMRSTLHCHEVVHHVSACLSLVWSNSWGSGWLKLQADPNIHGCVVKQEPTQNAWWFEGIPEI